MAALIQRVALQALQTFTKTTTATAFQENLQQLRTMVHRLTDKDLNFDPGLVENVEYGRDGLSDSPERVAPVTYLQLFEDHAFTIGIFVLKRGARLPLHDHPGMFGVIKVIHGTAEVHSYTEVKDRSIPSVISQHVRSLSRKSSVRAVDRFDPVLITPKCHPCVLTPDVGNFHEILSSEGPMAFLDILAPPYDRESGSRECNYYKEFSLQSTFCPQSSDGSKSNGHAQSSTNNYYSDKLHMDEQGSEQRDCYLVQIPQPIDFWCDTAEYTGPEINPYGLITQGCCTHI